MRFLELTKRNIKEICRDPLSISIAGVLPIGLFVLLGSLGGMAGESSILQPTMLAPGVALFGFSMVTFGAAFLLARDRENSLLARMLTTPLRPVDFKDIAADVQAFVGKPYAANYHGPCPCPSTVTCGTTPCAIDLHCGTGLCVDFFCTDECGRCTP
jgi:hypothetical protein